MSNSGRILKYLQEMAYGVKSGEYKVSFKGRSVGVYYVDADGNGEYEVFSASFIGPDYDIPPPELKESVEFRKPSPFFEGLMTEANRVNGTRRTIYEKGDVRVARVPEDVDKFYVYRVSAEEGDPDYSDEDHSAPHCEGYGPIEGMREWATWYCFNKRDDGTYEAELDESWWWGGGHNDGGTIRVDIPEEWQGLPYDEFLENVVTLAAARHYGFTAEHLRKKEGLKEFFGFRRYRTASAADKECFIQETRRISYIASWQTTFFIDHYSKILGS